MDLQHAAWLLCAAAAASNAGHNICDYTARALADRRDDAGLLSTTGRLPTWGCPESGICSCLTHTLSAFGFVHGPSMAAQRECKYSLQPHNGCVAAEPSGFSHAATASCTAEYAQLWMASILAQLSLVRCVLPALIAMLHCTAACIGNCLRTPVLLHLVDMYVNACRFRP